MIFAALALPLVFWGVFFDALDAKKEKKAEKAKKVLDTASGLTYNTNKTTKQKENKMRLDEKTTGEKRVIYWNEVKSLAKEVAHYVNDTHGGDAECIHEVASEFIEGHEWAIYYARAWDLVPAIETSEAEEECGYILGEVIEKDGLNAGMTFVLIMQMRYDVARLAAEELEQIKEAEEEEGEE